MSTRTPAGFRRAALIRPRWPLAASATIFFFSCGTAPAQQAVAPAATAATQTPDAVTLAAIKAAARGYQEALDRGDGKALAALWTPDGDIVDDEGRVLNGREAVRGITAAGTGSPRPAVHIEETSLRLLSADAAIEDGTVTVTPPGATTPLTGWFSATWVRHDGAWKLAGLRESRISAPQNATRLADLDWMVGDWTVVEDHPDREPSAGAAAFAAGGGPPIEVSVRWNATRTFLLRDMKISNASAAAAASSDAGDGLPSMHITQRIGWDPLSRQIVSWAFGSDGSHGEAVWTRDDDTWVARTMAVLPDGTQTSTLNIYSYDGANRCSWRSVPTHVGGEHAPHISMTMIRKPPTTTAPQASPPSAPKGSPAR
jgi:uncharacterized protein (TIGR02246 family)